MAAPRDDERLVDAYVDALLSRRESHERGHGRHGAGAAERPPEVPAVPVLDDPRLASAALRLHQSLVRFHPSFRFEDRVASRLLAVAQGKPSPTVDQARITDAPSPSPTVIPFPSPVVPVVADDPDHQRGLLLGGAIASGVSLAGAALYAWRRQRSGGSRAGRAAPADRSLARAARAAHRLGGAGGPGSVFVAARLNGRLAARREREGLA